MNTALWNERCVAAAGSPGRLSAWSACPALTADAPGPEGSVPHPTPGQGSCASRMPGRGRGPSFSERRYFPGKFPKLQGSWTSLLWAERSPTPGVHLSKAYHQYLRVWLYLEIRLLKR